VTKDVQDLQNIKPGTPPGENLLCGEGQRIAYHLVDARTQIVECDWRTVARITTCNAGG
jgi:hypothetical protein